MTVNATTCDSVRRRTIPSLSRVLEALAALNLPGSRATAHGQSVSCASETTSACPALLAQEFPGSTVRPSMGS